MKSSPLHPHPRRPRRLPPLTHLPTVRKLRVTAQFASRNSSRKQRTLSGAVPRVGIICTKSASSSGQEAKPEKRSDVSIGKRVLNAAERTDLTDVLLAVRLGRESREIWNPSGESRTREKSMGKDT